MGALRNFLKKITHPFLKKGLDLYYKKPRPFSYQGITVVVHPDVFPPQLTLSTQILLDYMAEIKLSQKTFLELGCGTGIISLFASKKEAIVTASDINHTALEYLNRAAQENKLPISCVHSNLFEDISEKSFHYIIINPPYYPKTPKNVKEQAWFCGENFDYFIALFEQLPAYISEENNTYMILSEDCNIKVIQNIATKNSLDLLSVYTIKKMGEFNTIYRIVKKNFTPT